MGCAALRGRQAYRKKKKRQSSREQPGGCRPVCLAGVYLSGAWGVVQKELTLVCLGDKNEGTWG